jgi:hypothetical protein
MAGRGSGPQRFSQPRLTPGCRGTLTTCWSFPRPGAAVELDQSLLEAKLSVPRARPGLVSRAGIIDATRASGCRVVGVTAPAS